MKKITFFVFTAIFLAGMLITIPQGFVHAQDPICTDAAGGVIPCPPTAEIPCGQAGGPACPPPPSEDSNDNGNQKPTSVPATATATATSTPFPLAAAPTNTATNEPAGLTPEVTPSATLPPTPTPGAEPLIIISAQNDDGTTSGNDDWDESCSWASCFAYDIMCWADGGSGYGQDDGAGGTVYHCDVPEGSTSGNNLKQLGLAATVVILIGLLLPAVQKIREAAARTRIESNRHKLMETLAKDDKGDTEAGFMGLEDIKGEANNESASKPKPKPKPKPTPPPSQPKPSTGDFNSDGGVDAGDFNL